MKPFPPEIDVCMCNSVFNCDTCFNKQLIETFLSVKHFPLKLSHVRTSWIRLKDNVFTCWTNIVKCFSLFVQCTIFFIISCWLTQRIKPTISKKGFLFHVWLITQNMNNVCDYLVSSTNHSLSLKVLDTFSNCQRPVFALGASQHMHEILHL